MNESESRDSVGQSDDLRTRIAAVLAEMDGMPWSMWSEPSQDGYLLRADAVISELGLKYVDGPLKGTPVHRYVTDWIPNG